MSDSVNPFPSASRVVRRLKKGRPVSADDVRRLENALRSVSRSNQQLAAQIKKHVSRIEQLMDRIGGREIDAKKDAPIH